MKVSGPYSTTIAILMGIIGATAIVIFGALRISGTSAIFFVLIVAMTTDMPFNPNLHRYGRVSFF